MKEKNQDEVEIDLLQLARALLKNVWAIILAMVIFGGCTLAYTAVFVKPLYEAESLMYVNNNSLSVGDAKLSISSGDITAAKSLVDTYAIILKTRATLEDVIEQADVPCSYEQLAHMIEAGSVNGTEVFYIKVTNENPQMAEKIANTISQILPEKIASIVEGCSARIVDYAVVPSHRSSPSLSKNTVLGALVGFVLACGIIIVKELMDDEIRSSDYLIETYDLPVLAVIPDLSDQSPTSTYDTYARAVNGGKKHG